MPFDALAQMEDVGRVVWLLPPFGQVGLYSEGARRHIRTNFIPHQRAIGEAQGGIGLEVDGEMVVKVRWIIAAHAQDTAALGLPSLRTPECRGAIEGQGRQRHASSNAGLQESTAAQSCTVFWMCLLHRHRDPSLLCCEVHDSLITNPWIETGVCQVYEQIDHYGDQRGEQNHALHHGIITLKDGI